MNQMSKILIPMLKLTYLSLTILPVNDPLWPKSTPRVRPLLQLNTGRVAPNVIPTAFMEFPSSLQYA